MDINIIGVNPYNPILGHDPVLIEGLIHEGISITDYRYEETGRFKVNLNYYIDMRLNKLSMHGKYKTGKLKDIDILKSEFNTLHNAWDYYIRENNREFWVKESYLDLIE